MSDDRKELAAERARVARERALELDELKGRLLQGEHLTSDDRRRAQEAAAEAAQRAKRAHERAGNAHEAAAETHRSAAKFYKTHDQPMKAEAHQRQADEDVIEAHAERDQASDSEPG